MPAYEANSKIKYATLLQGTSLVSSGIPPNFQGGVTSFIKQWDEVTENIKYLKQQPYALKENMTFVKHIPTIVCNIICT